MNPTTTENRVAFTGHRNYPYDAARIGGVLEALYREGNRTFLSGMALGFDLAAAEAVLELRRRHDDVRLAAIVPFRGQEERFPPSERLRYARILAAADSVIVLAGQYGREVYRVRNNFLVDHAATLVTWYDGHEGGTRQTVRRALQLKRRIIHLNPSTPPEAYPQPELFR